MVLKIEQFNLKISKSNVLRILKVLSAHNLIIEQKSGKKKVFRINSETKIVKTLWELFMSEKRYNLQINFKNIIDLFYEQVKDDIELFILFGSVAQGLITEESDIDIWYLLNKRWALEMHFGK